MVRGRTAAVVSAITAAVVAGTGFLADNALADPAEPSPAAVAARAQPLVPGTPCSVGARSCVDLDSQRAWLVADGKVVRGPVKIGSGGPGKETPLGHSFRVYLKDADRKSNEFKLANGAPAPMPWAVFFADGGIAFHAGDPARASAGCVRLAPADAKAWFDHLQVGDQVQVVRAGEETAARRDR
ncbi:MAG TPA: L,D-transpeptidase [Pseudonocardia sp.]|jgi:hypothetical protein